MGKTSVDAERMASDILYKNNEMLGILIMDMRGNILASNSTRSFRKAFGPIPKKKEEHGPSLAIAMLALTSQVKEPFGEPQALVTVFKHCKAMLIPSPIDQILLGLVLERSANVEDFLIAEDKGVGTLLLREYKR